MGEDIICFIWQVAFMATCYFCYYIGLVMTELVCTEQSACYQF